MKTVLAAVAAGLIVTAPMANAECSGHDKEVMASSAPTDKVAATPTPAAATSAKAAKPTDSRADKRPVATAKAPATEPKVVAATTR